tara:strand:+ start:3390 stop:3560 length:171 start_codon:yes stop_codon:yes gene_type:complete
MAILRSQIERRAAVLVCHLALVGPDLGSSSARTCSAQEKINIRKEKKKTKKKKMQP